MQPDTQQEIGVGQTPLRMGMIGGGIGAFIGPVHVRAAQLDGRVRLVAGAFSRTGTASREAGAHYGIDPQRAYPDYLTMFAEEAKRPDGIQIAAIVTPNDTHFAIARDALRAGLDVISDKPATTTLAEAIELAAIVMETGRHYALTYTYTGYPMLREARALIAGGALGAIRKVSAEYYQGWLAGPAEHQGNKQAAWRSDPARSGIGGCISDIGVHAFNLIEFVTACRVDRLNADLRRVVPGRALDDDCTMLIRFENGAGGLIAASQIATGERNGLRLRVWGEQGGLDWSHERPDLLTLNHASGTTEIRHAGWNQLGADAIAATRLPAGHPEGFIEALSNIYADFARQVHNQPAGDRALIQDIAEGVRSMAFVDAAISSNLAGEWRPLQIDR
jgi:predicted dehydrogenase